VKNLRITSVDAEDGNVCVAMESDDGGQFSLPLNTAETLSLMNLLPELLNDAATNPQAASASMPLHHVQYEQIGETLYFRVYVTDRVFHEYSVADNSTLSVALKAFADTYEAESVALAMRQSPGQTKN
jgi:hypothetical protein